MLRPRPLMVLRGLAVFAGALFVTWLALPSPIGSLPWIPSPPPALDGPYTHDVTLQDATTVLSGVVHGAEDITFDAAGRAFLPLHDGRIVRIEGTRVVDVAHVGDRALGLAFAPDGVLYACVPNRGLARIDVERGTVSVVVDGAEGDPIRHANAVTVGRDGIVYFTDSSAVWGAGQFLEDILDQRPSGRVLRYDPRSSSVLVLARDLSFANGLVLSPDESSLLVAETGRYRLWRLWLSGEKQNLKEVVQENLPGFPDNLTRSPRGTYWLGLSSTRKRIIDLSHPHPLWKDAIASLPDWLRPRPVRWGFLIELDGEGHPLRSLQDPEGVRVPSVTTALERDGVLWLGSLELDGIRQVAVPGPR